MGVQIKLCEIPREHVPYLSASAVVIHEEAVYQVYVPLPLLEADVKLKHSVYENALYKFTFAYLLTDVLTVAR